MLKPVSILIVCLNCLFVGCHKQGTLSDGSDGPVTKNAALSESAVTPQSAQGSKTSSSTDVSPQERPLVVDVNSNAEIDGVVRCIFQDSKDVLWIGGECGLFRNDGTTLTSYDIKDDLGRGVTIKKIVEGKDGNIWCGTTGGITRIDGRSFTSYGEKDGLISQDVWNLAFDASGVMWICTIEGVCRFDGKTFSPFPLPEAPPDPTRGVTSEKFVHCASVDRKGRVWFGTNGGAYVYDGKTLTNISERDGLPNNAVSGILEDKSGHIWFGTVHGGISRFDGNEFTNFTQQGVIEGKEVWCMHEGPSGNMWFSAKRSPLYRYDGNAFTKLKEQDEITSLAFTILEDSSGRLWLSGTHGLFRDDGESFVRVTKDGPWQ